MQLRSWPSLNRLGFPRVPLVMPRRGCRAVQGKMQRLYSALQPSCALARAGSQPSSDAKRAPGQSSAPSEAELTAFQACFLTIFAALMAAMASKRVALQSLIKPLVFSSLPPWLEPAASTLAVFIREGIMFWVPVGLAALSSWGIWQLVDRRGQRAAAATNTPTAGAAGAADTLPQPPVERPGEPSDVRQLRFQLYKAQQEASEAKHELQALRGTSPNQLARRVQHAAELARQLDQRTMEVRLVRMEAATVKQELAQAQQEVQMLSHIVEATLDSIRLNDSEEAAATVDAPQGGGEGGEAGEDQGTPLALARALQAKVAALNRRGDMQSVGPGKQQQEKLEGQVHDADATIKALNEQLASLKEEGRQAHAEVAALQKRISEGEDASKVMQAAAARAERHLDAYDAMVLRLEDQVEALEAEKLELLARLGDLPKTEEGAGFGAPNVLSNGAGPQ